MAPRKPNFKQIIFQLLDEHLSNQKPLLMEWECNYCFKHHRGNMLKKVSAIQESSEDTQAIELRDSQANLFAVIELTKNKKVNQPLANRYGQADVIYIELVAPGNLENSQDALLKPKFVNSCLNPRCKVCGGFQTDKSMIIMNSYCWKCEGPMKMAMIESPGHYHGPEDFTEQEAELARSNNVILEVRYSNTTQTSYLANICPHCNMFSGAFHLFDDHYMDLIYDESKYERIPQGYFCEKCFDNN